MNHYLLVSKVRKKVGLEIFLKGVIDSTISCWILGKHITFFNGSLNFFCPDSKFDVKLKKYLEVARLPHAITSVWVGFCAPCFSGEI